jgi:hypothetical protein
LNDDDLKQAWTSAGRVFLFVPLHQRKRVDALLPDPKCIVSDHSGKIVYSNRR